MQCTLRLDNENNVAFLKKSKNELLKNLTHLQKKSTELWQLWDKGNIDKDILTQKISNTPRKKSE